MYKIEKEKNNKFNIKIDLNDKEWQEYVNKAYEQTKNKYSVQGFRKGKAPRKVIEQNYGESIFYDDALEMAFQEKYGEVLDKEKEIEPVAMPEINIGKFDNTGLQLVVSVQSIPEIKLGKYTNLEIEKVKGEVIEEKITAEIEQARERLARFVVVERPAKLGDFVTIDFVGSVDGKEFDGGKAENYRLELGSKSFVDTFEDKIVGMNVGEKRIIKVTFPKEYFSENLKGKQADFEVILNKVEEKELPKLDDEFASNVSEFETFAEYKEDVKKHLNESLQEQLKRETENKIIETIVRGSEVDVPQVMVDKQLDSFVQDFKTRLMYQGMKMEDYLKYTNSSIDDFKKERKNTAKEAVKTRLVLEQIILNEKLQVKQEEIDAKITEIASKYNKSLEDYKKSISKKELIYFENGILMEKLMNFLTTHNTIK